MAVVTRSGCGWSWVPWAMKNEKGVVLAAVTNCGRNGNALDYVPESMKNDIAEQRRRNETELNREGDCKYLMNIMTRHIAAQKEKSNNLALCQAIGKGGKINVTPVNGEKVPCKFWADGKGCKFDKDCKFYHDKKIKQTPKSPGKGSGKVGGSNPRSSSPSAGGDTPCFKWNLHKCDLTAEDCKFKHRKCKPDELPAFEKYKALDKEREAKKKAAATVAAALVDEPSAKVKAKAKAKASADNK